MPCSETGGCASRAPGRRDAAPPRGAAWARLVLFACLAVALLAIPSRSFAQTTPEAPPPEGLILLPDAGPGAAATPGGGAPGSEFQDCPECPVMVVLPDGSAIGKYPVTRGEFAAFATATGFEGKGCNQRAGNTWTKVADSDWATPGYPQTDRDPVVCVSWLEANTYAEWLSEKTGKLYRLPTFEEFAGSGYRRRRGRVLVGRRRRRGVQLRQRRRPEFSEGASRRPPSDGGLRRRVPQHGAGRLLRAERLRAL